MTDPQTDAQFVAEMRKRLGWKTDWPVSVEYGDFERLWRLASQGVRTWQPTLRELTDTIASLYGNSEDCEDCADKAEAGNDNPCAVHVSARLWNVIRAAFEVLGPCPCGHPASQHHDEDMTRCKICDCEYFKLLPAPTPEREP